MNRLKILLVDDNQEFLGVAARFLSEHDSIEIAGLAHSGIEAVEMAGQRRPDLVIIDLSMPGMNGFEATRQLKSLPSPPRVIIVTLYDGPEFFSQARAFGADGFITKSQLGESLMSIVSGLFPLGNANPPANEGKPEISPAAQTED